MTTDWSKFKVYGGDPDDPLITMLTLTERGLILLPERFLHILFPRAKKIFAQILFAMEDRVLAIRFGVEKKPGFLTVTRATGNGRISAKSFLDYFKIDYTKTRSYLARVDLEEVAVFISLDQVLQER